MERLLVTGIDGPVGANLALALADRCQVLGLSSTPGLECAGVQIVYCADGNSAAVEEAVCQFQPHWVLHAPGVSAGSWDSPPAETSDPVRWTIELAELAHRTGARLTVLSSDVVFAGPRMFHEERWPTTSPAPRARLVRALERAAEERHAMVVRTHAYGWSPTADRAGFAEQVHGALDRGQVIRADGLRHASPILASDLAELLWRAHELKLHGLYHMAGAERTSAFRFVTELAAEFGLPAPQAQIEAPLAPAATWHDETSLSSRRARRALEMSTAMVREGLERFAAQAAGGWVGQFRLNGRSSDRRELAA